MPLPNHTNRQGSSRQHGAAVRLVHHHLLARRCVFGWLRCPLACGGSIDLGWACVQTSPYDCVCIWSNAPPSPVRLTESPNPTQSIDHHSGRLHQVEYAIEAINNAGTCVGILCKDGIVLAGACGRPHTHTHTCKPTSPYLDRSTHPPHPSPPYPNLQPSGRRPPSCWPRPRPPTRSTKSTATSPPSSQGSPRTPTSSSTRPGARLFPDSVCRVVMRAHLPNFESFGP